MKPSMRIAPKSCAIPFPTLRFGISWRSANGGANGPSSPRSMGRQNVYHHRQRISFVPAALALRTQRKHRSSFDHFVGIFCMAPFAVNGPALGIGSRLLRAASIF